MRTVILLSLFPSVTFAFFTPGLVGEGNAVTFSDEFKKAYAKASVDLNDPVCITKLKAMLERFTQDEEQAEIELTLGVIYGQRAGLVNPTKAVAHFTKALKHDLPATVRTQVLVWRGNAREQQKRVRAALLDYIRGLLVCTQFDLSRGWPADPPPLKEDTRKETAVEPRSIGGERYEVGPSRSEDALMQARLIRIERQMLMSRYFLIEGVKRALKRKGLSEQDLNREIGCIVSDPRRARQIASWCQSENSRPWR